MKASSSSVILLIISFFSLQVMAEERNTIGSKLSEATVFFKGAELTHTATANLTKGENEIYVEGLSPVIDVNSLKVKFPNGIVVSAYEYTVDYLRDAAPSKTYLKIIEDSINVCQNKLDKISIDRKINTNMLKYLQEGISKNISGSEVGLGIDELVKTIDYYKSKSEEVETLLQTMEKQEKEINETVVRLKYQRDQENMKGNKTSGVLKLTLSASRPGNTTFSITYFTTYARWIPYFDINVESTDKPIKITQKSKVRQTTGLDWEKVKLTLSTAIPSNGKVAPLFSAWFLQQEYYSQPSFTGFINTNAIQNSYSYSKAKPVGAKKADLAFRREGAASSDGNTGEPLYVIDGVFASKDEFGAIDAAMIKNMEVVKDASATSTYGARASNGVILVELKSSMDDYVTESDNALNQVYNIELPYSIPGNGKEQSIDLLVKETPADYKYYCAPKLDIETYLLAEISSWEKLGLLSGKANITYDGTYIGETFIDAASTQSKLTLTLGTDKRVIVKRELMKDFSSKKPLGGDISQLFVYKFTVKNNQNKSIKMVLKDQYPISTQKKIDVILMKETSPWTANVEGVGVITWEENIDAGDTKYYQISYTVKYPKDMKLNL